MFCFQVMDSITIFIIFILVWECTNQTLSLATENCNAEKKAKNFNNRF